MTGDEAVLSFYPSRGVSVGVFAFVGIRMRLSKVLALALSASLILVVCSFAREAKKGNSATRQKAKKKPYALEKEVVVTATRTETDSSNVSAFVTVVRPDKLPVRPKTAADMLKSVSGLRISRYGGGLSLASPSIRGSLASQVLIMVDGVRLNSARGDGADLSDIPADIIDRIEVIRGGSSALYGSDAMGGVINIITKRGTKRPTTRVSLTAGSFDTFGGTVSHSATLEKLAYDFSLSYLESEGDFPYESRGEQTKRIKNGNYTAAGGFLRASYQLGKGTRLSLTHILNHLDKHLPGRIEFPTPDAEQKNQWSLTTFVLDQKDFLAKGLSASLTANWRAEHLSYYDPIFVGSTPSGYTGHRGGAELMLRYSAGLNQLITFAASASDETQHSINSGTHTRTTSSLFLQNLISLFDEKIILTPAARLDRYSDVGESFNPKLGLCLKPLPFLSFKANASRSFRVPGFDDLYWPRSAFARGNPDLEPETCHNYDAGFELRIEGNVRLEVAYFLNRAKNLIQWQPGRGGVWSPTNVGRARTVGIESRLVASLFKWCQLELTHTYTDAKDTTDPENTTQLIRRPRNRTTALLSLGYEKISASVQVRRTSRSFTTAANTQWLPSHTLVDCGINVKPLKHLAVEFSVQNLSDESYQMVPGYAMPGRSYSLTVNLGFEGR